MTQKLIEEYKKKDPEINVAKTDYMSIAEQQQNLILEDGEKVREYKYSGVNLSQNGTLGR